MELINHQFQLAARPVGLPKPSDWHYAEAPVADPGPDEVLVKINYIGLEPAMRGWTTAAPTSRQSASATSCAASPPVR